MVLCKCGEPMHPTYFGEYTIYRCMKCHKNPIDLLKANGYMVKGVNKE